MLTFSSESILVIFTEWAQRRRAEFQMENTRLSFASTTPRLAALMPPTSYALTRGTESGVCF